MPKLKHNKVNMQKWLPIKLPKHRGKTLPQIVFEDPSYVVWLYQKDVLISSMHKGEYQFKLAHQIEVIQNRMTKIRPSAGCKFAIVVDQNDVFGRFIVLKKGRSPNKPLKKGWEIVEWLDLLDIGLPLGFRNQRLGFERMRQCLIEECFGDANAKVHAKACNDFLQDDKRFDLRGVKCNKWLTPGPKDRAALEKKCRRLILESKPIVSI